MARVYVSSTVADLADERRAVIDWLSAVGHQPVQSYVPHTETLRDSSLSDVARCDLFVLIVGHRYGFQPQLDNPDQLSITHLEYNRARQCGIPVIALLRNRIPDVRLSDIENDSGLSRVKSFRAAVQMQHRTAEFGDLRELIHALSAGIHSGLTLRRSDSTSARDGSKGAAIGHVSHEDIVIKVASDLANALKRELESEKAAKREDTSRAIELPRLLTTKPMMDAALERHRKFVRNWAAHVPTKDDSGNELETRQVFVPLDAFVTPRKLTVQSGNPPSKPLDVLLEESTARHTILLGPPGAGKTTSVKQLCLRLLDGDMPAVRVQHPIVILLRELQREVGADDVRHPLIDVVRQAFDIQLYCPAAWKEDRARLERLAIIEALEHAKSIVFLDGLDELEVPLRRRVEEDISFLALRLGHARLFLTCRTGAFAQHIDGSAEYELVDLSYDQMAALVRQSLGADVVAHFFQLLDARPYAGTMRRPLLLQNLCYIYRLDKTLPAKAIDVYQRVVTLMIREWDEKRQVTRLSKWPGFDANRKRAFLAELAYRLTMRGHNAVFTEQDLTLAFAKVRERFRMLPADSCLDIAAELEEDTGLIVGSATAHFEFFHKSIQEFLCAEHILALTHKPYSRDEVLRIPNELAIVVSLSADPGSRLAEIDRTIRDQSLGFVFYHTFVTRLILEDCDFEPTESTACALLNLYSGLISSATTDTHRHELHSTGAALTLQQMINERMSMQVVVDAYTVSKTTDRIGDDPVVVLRRRDQVWVPQADATRALVQYELRGTLYALASALLG